MSHVKASNVVFLILIRLFEKKDPLAHVILDINSRLQKGIFIYLLTLL